MPELLSPHDVQSLANDCLVRAGVSPDVAKSVSEEIAAAEASDHAQHGMRALLRDLRLIRYGHLLPNAQSVQQQPKPGVLTLDAQHGFAAAALADTSLKVTTLAKSLGVALLKVDRCSDPGGLFCAVERIAGQGAIAFGFTANRSVRMAHPDTVKAVELTQAPMPALEALTGQCFSNPGQPTDSPLGGRVMHTAWILAMDPAATDRVVVDHALSSAKPLRTPKREIALTSELLAEIVAA